jgi:hypothetical protein
MQSTHSASLRARLTLALGRTNESIGRERFQEPLIAFQTCSSLVCGGCCLISTLLCGRRGCDYRSLGAQVPTVTG